MSYTSQNSTIYKTNFYSNMSDNINLDDDYEKWVIKCLPNEWEPNTRPSEGINKYLALLKERHENCIKEMSSEVALINTELETEIRLKANEFKKELNDLKQIGNDFLPHVEDSEKIFDYDINNFKTSKTLIMGVLLKGQEAINNFCCFLGDLEKERTDKIKKVYAVYYKKFLKIAHLKPYELQLFFETHILHTNQVILNNLRVYTELYCDVNVKYENDIKLLLFKIQDAKEDWKRIYKEKIKKLFSHFDVNTDDIEEVINNSTDIMEIMKFFMEKQIELKSKLSEEIPFMNENLETWYNNVDEIMEGLNNSGYDLLKSFGLAIDNFLTKRQKDFEESNSTVEIPEMREFFSDILEPRVRFIRNEMFSEIQTFQEKWNLAIEDALLNLAYIHEFINEYGKIITRHTDRLKQAQRLVSKNLDQVMADNDKQLRGAEISLNVIIDTLRQEVNEKKAEKDFKKIEKTLDGISKIISKNHDIELEVISKYFNFIESESDILKAELNQFLSKYSKKNQMHTLTENESRTMIDEKLSPTQEELIKITEIEQMNFDSPKNNTPIENTSETYIKTVNDYVEYPGTRANLIFKRLTDCKVNVLINQSKQKIVSTVDDYINNIADDQMYRANEWSSILVDKIEERFKTLRAEHANRLPRIKLDVFDVRIAELNLHQQRFQRHKTTVDGVLPMLKQKISEFKQSILEESDVSIRYESLKRIEEEASKINEIGTSSLANNLLYSVEHMSKTRLSYISNQFDSFNESIFSKIEEVTKSNNKFLRSIRLFSETGNYNTKEAMGFSKKLSQIDKNFTSKSADIKKDLIAFEKGIIDQLTKATKDLIAPIIDKIQNLKHQEQSNNIIEIIQEEIKHEVVDMKLKNKRVDIKFNEIKNIVINRSKIELKDHLKNIHNTIKNTMKYLNDYEHYLLEEDDPPLIAMPIESEIKLTERDDKSSVKPKKDTNPKRKSKIFINYCEDFFVNQPEELPDHNRFMPKIRKQIIDSLKNTQESAQKYYEPPEYDEYMKQFVKKYKNYYLQCGQAWLEQIQGYVRFINDFQQYITDYCQQTFIDFHHKKMNQIKHIQNETVEDANKLYKDNIQLIRNTRDKLKPLHGYPENKGMLQGLDEELGEVLMETKKKFDEFMDYTKVILGDNSLINRDNNQELSKHKEDYEMELEEVKKNIKEIEREVFVDNFIDVLLKQAEQFITNFGTHLENENNEEKIEELLKAFKKASSFTPPEISIFPKIDTEMNGAGSSITDHPIIQTFFDVYQQQLMYDVNEIFEIKKKHHEEVDNHQDMWKADIDHVLDLYTVKYK